MVQHRVYRLHAARTHMASDVAEAREAATAADPPSPLATNTHNGPSKHCNQSKSWLLAVRAALHAHVCDHEGCTGLEALADLPDHGQALFGWHEVEGEQARPATRAHHQHAALRRHVFSQQHAGHLKQAVDPGHVAARR